MGLRVLVFCQEFGRWSWPPRASKVGSKERSLAEDEVQPVRRLPKTKTETIDEAKGQRVEEEAPVCHLSAKQDSDNV
jgi:hypothetical protein